MPQAAVLLALSALPPALLVGLGGASWGWMLLRAGAWALAVVIKAVPGAALWWAIERAGVSLRARSAAWGVWSAACELGVSAAVFLTATEFPSLLDMIGFGIGAGSFGALVVAGAAVASARVESPEDSASDPASSDRFLAWSGVIERGLASVGHVASRGLVWVGLQSWLLSPFALAACATFGVVDGVSTYGSEAGWDWHDRRRLKYLYSLVAKVTAVEVVLMAIALHLLQA
ncbi:hypothetical protein WI460_11665 [Gemmatimonadota bacterium Y43]|uniref:hypothetical protein n=1 Tax=Gaopeijia maritima TaxID=3119007 RepID=UPI00328D1154